MKGHLSILLIIVSLGVVNAQSQIKSITLTDVEWDKESPAAFQELFIPSQGSVLQGLMYKANGSKLHPTLIMLHGYPGNERNLDLAQIIRGKGWNVIYFNYRGSWGSQGNFSFENSIEDVVNAVEYLRNNSGDLQIDSSNMVLFGHSMGGWICLKALQQLKTIKKGFVISAWDIAGEFKGHLDTEESMIERVNNGQGEYFVLNTPIKEIFSPVMKYPEFFDLSNDGKALSGKEIVMVDEHKLNEHIARAIEKENTSYFQYHVWDTDHSFTNKRVSLALEVLEFLDKK